MEADLGSKCRDTIQVKKKTNNNNLWLTSLLWKTNMCEVATSDGSSLSPLLTPS